MFALIAPDDHALRRFDTFAGWWEHRDGAEGTAINSCTILTATPNDLLRHLHRRMAVNLAPEDYAPWGDPKIQEIE